MNGYIIKRTKKYGFDGSGKKRNNVDVFDVYYYATDPATGKRKKFGKRGFKTKKLASEYLLQANNDMNNGSFRPETKMKLGEYLTNWLETYSQTAELRPNTVSSYRTHLFKYIIPKIGMIHIQQLNSQRIETFYAELRKNGRTKSEKGLSSTTISYINRILNEALKHAVSHHIISRNPIDDIIKKPTRSRYIGTTYTVQEVQKLLELEMPPALRTAIALAGFAGLRRGECLGLRPEDIDAENNILHIRRQVTVPNNTPTVQELKTENSTRDIIMIPALRKIIDEQLAHNNKQQKYLGSSYHNDGWLICNDDGSIMNPNYLTHHFSTLIRSRHLKKIRFHDLRHTCASLLLEAGVDIKTVSTILGHSSISTTADTYTHVLTTMKQDAANKLSSLISPDTPTMIEELKANYPALEPNRNKIETN